MYVVCRLHYIFKIKRRIFCIQKLLCILCTILHNYVQARDIKNIGCIEVFEVHL